MKNEKWNSERDFMMAADETLLIQFNCIMIREHGGGPRLWNGDGDLYIIYISCILK